MRIWLAIPTMHQPRLMQALHHASEFADEHDTSILVHSNGTPLDLTDDHLTSLYQQFLAAHQTYSHANIGVVPALHELYRLADSVAEDEDILAYIHDDVLIEESGWDSQLLDFFAAHPQAALAGFHGARRLGSDELYRVPYQLMQLARGDCYSNMRDAESHGARTAKAMRVATVDGFAQVVRMSFLRAIDGWDWWPKDIVHHSYDNALACMVARFGFETWLYPLRVHHHGGLTSTGVNYMADFNELEGSIHARSHRWLYDSFRDVLPLRVP